jgi:serine/threonine-protein kinase RsbW
LRNSEGCIEILHGSESLTEAVLLPAAGPDCRRVYTKSLERRTDMSDSTGELEGSPLGPSCPLRRDKLVAKFCEIIPSNFAGLDSVVEKAMTIVKGMPCAPESAEQVELSLREALVNAILHGNRADPQKNVLVACFCECEANGGLLLVVRDEGAGFDPSEVPDPTQGHWIDSEHGRGIFLMRQFMDEVSYRNGGREVELRKRRK